MGSDLTVKGQPSSPAARIVVLAEPMRRVIQRDGHRPAVLTPEQSQFLRDQPEARYGRVTPCDDSRARASDPASRMLLRPELGRYHQVETQL
jgi:hypothetical protein